MNTENKKYYLTTETRRYMGRTLYRIRALRDFADVKKGDFGGCIASEDSLSHEGDCWIPHERETNYIKHYQKKGEQQLQLEKELKEMTKELKAKLQKETK